MRVRLGGQERMFARLDPACLAADDDEAVMSLAPWLVCALLAWCMWWYWQRQKRK